MNGLVFWILHNNFTNITALQFDNQLSIATKHYQPQITKSYFSQKDVYKPANFIARKLQYSVGNVQKFLKRKLIALITFTFIAITKLLSRFLHLTSYT